MRATGEDSIIHGDGEMARLIRDKDWNATPLGPLAAWPETLRTTLNLILAVPTPMQFFWGPHLLTFYNDALRPFLGDKHPRALGRVGSEVWHDTWAEVGAEIEAIFQNRRSSSYHNLPLTLIYDGQPKDTFWTFSLSPVYDLDGSVAAVLNATQNTTEAVQSQRALAASELRFRTLVDKASVGIAMGTITGELTFINPFLLSALGYSAEEVARGDVRWDALTPRRYLNADLHAISQLRSSGVADPYEKAYCSKSGELIPLLVSASIIPADQEYGDQSNVAVVATDLRKQKRAEAALLQNEKLAAVGKLASSISHEINNPLEAVTNLLYIVRQDANLSQSSRDYLETADRELARVSQVASQTLRFHRQSTAAKTIPPECLVIEVLQLYGNRLTNAGISIHRDFQPDTLLTCYEGDIRQVLNNLVGNAADAMRNGGHLTIRTRKATRFSNGEPGILISIADTGSGIPEAVRQHIFDAFYTTKGNNGTGLGLWISCRIVHKHRGYIRVHSSTSARHPGTVFHLWLPVQLASSASEPWHQEDIGIT